MAPSGSNVTVAGVSKSRIIQDPGLAPFPSPFRSRGSVVHHARAGGKWRVTSLALSVARWVHNSTMTTFPEAPYNAGRPDRPGPVCRASGSCVRIMRCGRFPLVLLRPTPCILEVVRLAYNLVTAFQRTCLSEEWQSLTLSTLQTLLVAWRTYPPTEPTYPSIREFAPHPEVGD
jgi:hypothetical protein